MSAPNWHVFYRTISMSGNGVRGWARADIQAGSASEALAELMRRKHNVLHARVYPGASVWSVEVQWQPTVEVKHSPHEPEVPT